MANMQANARILADRLQETGRFELIGHGEEQLPLVAFRLAGENGSTSSTSHGNCPLSGDGWSRPTPCPRMPRT